MSDSLFDLARRSRSQLGLALLILFGVASIYRQTVNALDLARGDGGAQATVERVPARAVVYDERFDELRGALPPRAIAGYLTDAQRGADFTSPDVLKEFFLAQYSLAPAILIRGTEPALVIVNLPEGSDAAKRARLATLGASFRVVVDFGGGVVLLERAGE